MNVCGGRRFWVVGVVNEQFTVSCVRHWSGSLVVGFVIGDWKGLLCEGYDRFEVLGGLPSFLWVQRLALNVFVGGALAWVERVSVVRNGVNLLV